MHETKYYRCFSTFSFLLHAFDKKRGHNMLALMLDPKFKTMWLVTTYLSCKNVVYDEKLSLCLLTKATDLLMPNSIEEIENLQSQVHIEDLFHTTTTNVGTFRDLVSRKLVEICPYFV
jgi:hypothetical protein